MNLIANGFSPEICRWNSFAITALAKLLTLKNERGQSIAAFDLTSAAATSHALATNCKWETAVKDGASIASPTTEQVNISSKCDVLYLSVNTSDNRLYTPILSATLERLSLDRNSTVFFMVRRKMRQQKSSDKCPRL